MRCIDECAPARAQGCRQDMKLHLRVLAHFFLIVDSPGEYIWWPSTQPGQEKQAGSDDSYGAGNHNGKC